MDVRCGGFGPRPGLTGHARSVRTPSPLPGGLGDAFSIARAAELGVTRRRTRGSDLAIPFRGVRVRKEPTTHAGWCSAYVPRLAPGQFFSHLSAAVLWGIPLSAELERAPDVHIGVRWPGHPPQVSGAIGHRLPAGVKVRVRSGMPLLNPADTWAYLGTALPHEQLVVVGDFLVRRKRPLATLGELRDAASARRPGIRAVRRALVAVRSGTDSPKETELRLAIVEAGLPEPMIGHTVKDSLGNFIATPDLAYVRQRIAIEYEGRMHFTDPHVYAQDIVRYELLEEAGWLVVRVIARDLGYRRNLLLSRIESALARRA